MAEQIKRSITGSEDNHDTEKVNKTTRVYVVRHGESEANVDEHFVGDANLTEKGVKQARALGKIFYENGVRFDSVVTSGKPRAVQTAEGILEEMGLEILADINKEFHEKREGLPYGKLPPKTIAQIRREYKNALRSLPDEERWDYIPRVEGIDRDKFETDEAVAQRFEKALQEVVKAHPGESVLIVSHYHTMVAYQAMLHKRGLVQDLETSDKSLFTKYGPKNTGYFALDVTQGEAGNSVRFIERDLKGASDVPSKGITKPREDLRTLSNRLASVRKQLAELPKWFRR